MIFKVWVLKRFILFKIVFKKSLEWQWLFNNNCNFLFSLCFLYDMQMAIYLISSRKYKRKSKHEHYILELRNTDEYINYYFLKFQS